MYEWMDAWMDGRDGQMDEWNELMGVWMGWINGWDV
jgi:hypothetical protein